MQLAHDIRMIDNNFSNESSGESSRAGKKILTFIHGLGLACGLILSSWFLARTFQTTAPVSSAPSVAPLEDPSDAFHASGPWGTLMVETIYTEKPAHFIDVAPLLKSEEKWLFPGMDLGNVRQWMTTNGFDEKAIEELVTAGPEENPQGLYLHPTQKWIAALEPSQRKKFTPCCRKIRSTIFHKILICFLLMCCRKSAATPSCRERLVSYLIN